MSAAISFPGGFCVLMALYGRDKPNLFIKAIQSVFANTLHPNQVLVVVDGPLSIELDQTVSKLHQEFPEIEFVRLPKNIGLANALNAGLQSIRFPWVVRADSDDINLVNRFEVLANIVREDPSLQLVGSAILEIDEEGNPLKVREVPTSEKEIRQFAKTRNPFNHMAVAYKLNAVLESGGYPNIFLKEDYGLWCHFLARNLPVANVRQVLVHASAGLGMFRRRGGWRYAQSEYRMQKLLVHSGLKGRVSALKDGVMRATFFLIPASWRGFLYSNFLRKPPE